MRLHEACLPIEVFRQDARCKPHCEPTLANPARVGHPHPGGAGAVWATRLSAPEWLKDSMQWLDEFFGSGKDRKE